MIVQGNSLLNEMSLPPVEELRAPALVVLEEYRRLMEGGPPVVLGADPPPWRRHGWLLAIGFGAQAQLSSLVEIDRKMREAGEGSVLAGLSQETKKRWPHMVDALRKGGFVPPTGWAYMLSTMLNGRLPSEPLPQVNWDTMADAAVSRYVQRLLGLVGNRHGPWSQLRILMEWMGYGLAVHPTYPRELDDGDAEALYRELDLAFFWLHPNDIWGSLMGDNIGSGWNPNAFFPTPMNITEMMAKMVGIDVGVEGRHLTVMDPCVGTGRMLLSSGNSSMRLYGVDIDPLMVLATKINLAVHMPWGVVTFNDAWWNREIERLGLDRPARETEQQPGLALPGVRAAGAEEVEMLSSMAGHDVAAAAAKRTARVGGQVVQLYLPGFWEERA